MKRRHDKIPAVEDFTPTASARATHLIEFNRAGAKALLWTFQAKSNDETRMVLNDRVWITKRPLDNARWWALCTDGKRVHAAVILPTPSLVEAGPATYKIVKSSAAGVLLERQPGDVYPNAWQVVPSEDGCMSREVFYTTSTFGTSNLFELCIVAHSMHRSVFNHELLQQAFAGFARRKIVMFQKSQHEPIVVCDEMQADLRLRMAVIMPLRPSSQIT